MSGLISNAELVAQLEAMLPKCKNLTIISAFVTQPAISWLGNLFDHQQSKVQIVGRFTPNDFISGASDINALRMALDRDYAIKALENLHAKIYQIDRDTIFNGSANLTGKGLALLSDGNLESCSKVDACEDSLRFIEKLLNLL